MTVETPAKVDYQICLGDVLLFEGSYTDKLQILIMLLSGSKYTHAALGYSKDSLVDEGLAGLATHVAKVSSNGRPTHVMRHTVACDGGDVTPLKTSADFFIDQDLPYDHAGLVLAGLLLLYKKGTAFSGSHPFATKLLKLAANVIDRIYAETHYEGKRAMICSQFVYECFEQAANDGHEELRLVKKSGALAAGAQPSLITNCLNKNLQFMEFSNSIAAEALEIEHLCKQVVDQFEDDIAVPLNSLGGQDDIALDNAVIALSRAYLNDKTSDEDTILQKMSDLEGLFVSPGDLATQFENLRVASKKVLVERIA